MELFWSPAARHFFQALNHLCGSFLPPVQFFNIFHERRPPCSHVGAAPFSPARVPPGAAPTPQPTAAPSGSQTWSCDCAAFHEYFLAVSSSSSAFLTYEGGGKKEKKKEKSEEKKSTHSRLCHWSSPCQVFLDCSIACLWIAPEPLGSLPSMEYSSSVWAKLHRWRDVNGFMLRGGHPLLCMAVGCPCAPLLGAAVVEMGWGEMPPCFLGMPSPCCHDARHQTHL